MFLILTIDVKKTTRNTSPAAISMCDNISLHHDGLMYHEKTTVKLMHIWKHDASEWFLHVQLVASQFFHFIFQAL